MQTILALVGVAFAYGIYLYISNLRHNISLAKKTGLPYVVTPCSPIWLPSQLTVKLWAPIVRLLPKSWWESWLDILMPDLYFRTRHELFARYGDVFIIVSPGMLYTLACNAEVISQVASRRESFPKPLEAYAILSQFGENVLTTEGAVWRMHRKATSPSFNEKNAALVFKEAIRQAHGLTNSWTGPARQTSKTIHSLDHDTMRLALNIIGYVGFGISLLWPGETLPDGTEPKLVKYGSLSPTVGHKLSFADTVATCLENILMLLLVPRWLLRLIPTNKTKLAADSGEDFTKYMEEMMDEKIDESRRGERVEGMDLMGHLVRSSYGRRGELRETGEKDENVKPGTLSRSDICGNAFIMLVAGHETTANAMHFILMELANNPASQRRLQKDVDQILGDKDPNQWDYESLINPMLASMLGACMNETLRLMPAVVEIPKMVTRNRDQSITMDGQQYVLPKGMAVSLVAVSVHRNPRYWPGRPSKIHSGKDDINDWVPERWFRGSETSTKTAENEHGGMDTEDFGGYGGPDTSAQLFRPERGAYIPFSDGPRSCLGRRIAQVEIVAALAVIFRSYSLELAVDEWATDEEVEVMNREKRTELYKTAQDASRSMMGRAASVLTLKLHGGDHVPIRLVKRGDERFVSWMDE